MAEIEVTSGNVYEGEGLARIKAFVEPSGLPGNRVRLLVDDYEGECHMTREEARALAHALLVEAGGPE